MDNNAEKPKKEISLSHAIYDRLPRGKDGEDLAKVIAERLREVTAQAYKDAAKHIETEMEKSRNSLFRSGMKISAALVREMVDE